MLQIGLLTIGQLIPPLPFLVGAGVKLLLLLLLVVGFILLQIITPYEAKQALLFVRAHVPRRKSLVEK